MPQRNRRILFTPRERRLMIEHCELPADLQALLAGDGCRSQAVVLTESQLDVLRDAVADRLQRAGFDEDWKVNQEGAELETIIDKLQPPTNDRPTKGG